MKTIKKLMLLLVPMLVEEQVENLFEPGKKGDATYMASRGHLKRFLKLKLNRHGKGQAGFMETVKRA